MDRIIGLCTQIPTPRREAFFSSDRGFFLRSGGRTTWWAELGHAAGHLAWSCLLRSGIPPGIRVGNIHRSFGMSPPPFSEGITEHRGRISKVGLCGDLATLNTGKPRALGWAK